MRAMSASAAAPGQVAPAKRPRLPVPRSNVTVEVVISLTQSQRIDHGPAVLVRCAACDRRLFDLRAELDGLRSLVASRKCPGCGRLNSGLVTCSDGHPLTASDALSGDWWCECGHNLGRVDAVRGRITVLCRRCKVKARVTAADAIAVACREDG